MKNLQTSFWMERKWRCVLLGKPKVHLEDFNDMLNFELEQTQERMLEMEFSMMEPFPNHKFKLYEGQQLMDMVESIRQCGILLPIILWHTKDERYIILSGHNRCNAARLVGLKKAPVIIKEDLTYEEAVLIVTESNLRQRSFGDMSHSERAYCLAQHYDALKAQGKRNDLLNEIEILINPHISGGDSTSVQCEQKLENREKVGQEYGLSASKVGRYIKIASLIEPLLTYVDSGEIPFLAAYNLSFIEDTKRQEKIAELMEANHYKINIKKAEVLRNYYETQKLKDAVITQILSGEKTKKPKSNRVQSFKVKPAVITKYFTVDQSSKEIEDIIEQALALYFENKKEGTA